MTIQKKTRILTHKQMVTKMLKKPSVRAKVEELNRTEFGILDEILAARKAAGLTQAQVAKKIARLESSLATGKHSPSLNTLKKYAEAVGKKVQVHLV